MKYYAVKNGKIPGIYTTWDDCRAQVHGYSGAIYKSFATETEARAFLGDTREDETCINRPTAYVDGSYNAATGIYGSGAVILGLGEKITFSESGADTELAKMHNVAGEILASQLVMAWCVDNNIPQIDICHDYEGIAAWAEGRWKTNKDGTAAYKEYYDSIKDKLKVRFVKVKGHSGDKYNDLADKLAKEAAGI